MMKLNCKTKAIVAHSSSGQYRRTESRCKTEAAHNALESCRSPAAAAGVELGSTAVMLCPSRRLVTSRARPLAEKRPKFLINKQREAVRHSSDLANDAVTVAVATAADDDNATPSQ